MSALPPSMLCAALGLALSFTRRDAALTALAVLVMGAVLTSVLWRSPGSEVVIIGCWVSVAATAATVHLPGGGGRPTMLLVAANAGLWTGAAAATGPRLPLLAETLPLGLLCWPGGWLVRRGWGLAVKVVASWLIAIAVLAAALPFAPRAAGDHMD